MGGMTEMAFEAIELDCLPSWLRALGWEGGPLPAGLDLGAREGMFDRTLLACACASRMPMEGLIPALAAQSEVDAVDADGKTPLMLLSAGSGSLEAARDLLLAGADPGKRCSVGFDALCWAARGGSASLVDALVEHCDPLARTPSGMTPLMLAACGGLPGAERCASLLAPASDLGARDGEGMTALDHARRCGSPALGPILAAVERRELEAIGDARLAVVRRRGRAL